MDQLNTPLKEVRKKLKVSWYRCPIDPILFRKLIEYCENNIEGGFWDEYEDDFSSKANA